MSAHCLGEDLSQKRLGFAQAPLPAVRMAASRCLPGSNRRFEALGEGGQAVAQGAQGGLDPIVHAELAEDAGEMGAHRALAQGHGHIDTAGRPGHPQDCSGARGEGSASVVRAIQCPV